jgi:soluble lytic murein transglycosylase-like protein
VIVLNQLAPTPAAAVLPSAAVPAPAAADAAEVAALPVVSPDQVTGPGTPAPAPTARPAAQSLAAQAAGAQPAPAFAPTATRSPGDGLTYAQMFQEIALRYDLDWRVLAAQAYVESSFDALALGNSGDMGLMQVLPATWREWAPVVEANDPFDAYSNALVAAAYLDYLRTLLGKRGLPEIRWMLVAYNWGPDQLAEFLDGGSTWETLPEARRQYADDILRIAATIP